MEKSLGSVFGPERTSGQTRGKAKVVLTGGRDSIEKMSAGSCIRCKDGSKLARPLRGEPQG